MAKIAAFLGVALPGVAFLGVMALTAPARAEHTRVTNPNALSVEVLGRGLLYSISYDRVATDDLVAGIGIGSVSLKTAGGTDANASVTMIPFYANYYFTRDGNSLYGTAGATLVSNSSSASSLKSSAGGVEFGSSSVLPNFGLGYESRGDSGFLFRVAAYAIVADNVAPWGGFTLGYSF
jgi:hypothetical protein